MAPPIRTRSSFPYSSLSHQETSIKLLPLPPKGGQNENHNHRKRIKLITWTMGLSNSIKLWAMPGKATQDRWVMVESSDKMWSTGEGNMQSTSWETLSWKKHKLESRLPGGISITSNMQMIPPLWQKVKKNKEPLDESEKWKWSRSVVSDSWRPHGLQPTRLLRPWDLPGKSTRVGCHCLL